MTTLPEKVTFKVRDDNKPADKVVEFFLVHESGLVRLKARIAGHSDSWYILDITDDGKIQRHFSVPCEELGLIADGSKVALV
jgi:hypothetical protein